MQVCSLFPSKYIGGELTDEEVWFKWAKERIEDAAKKNNWQYAQQIAIEWARGVCLQIGLPVEDNWKFFKRSLVAKWFGKVERKRFPSGWSITEALEYAYSLGDRPIRFSFFPPNIACHSKSYQLPDDQKMQWERFLSQFDRTIPMEMFPLACGLNALSFRRYTTQFGEDVIYEFGRGQPFLMFEQEQGRHLIVSATKNMQGGFVFRFYVPKKIIQENLSMKIEEDANRIIQVHDHDLSSRCFCLCHSVGIETVAIEGCMSPTKPEIPVIVDLDLPFDVVFMFSND